MVVWHCKIEKDMSDCCHACSDDALCHAAAESNIHRHYAGEERTRYCRNQEGACNGGTDGDRHQKEH